LLCLDTQGSEFLAFEVSRSLIKDEVALLASAGVVVRVKALDE